MKQPQPRQALGRGFSALLRPTEDLPKDDQARVAQLKMSEIVINPKQPRTHFDAEKLEELAQSIRIKGVIQPVLVRKKGDAYELIAGERRLRASKLAGFTEIPALIKEIDDKDVLEIALIENIQRHDLNPIDESLAYQNLLQEHNFTQEDLARRVGKNRSTVANMLRLLALPKEIQGDLASGNLTIGHARCLLAVENHGEQLAIKNRIVKENLSVRATEALVKAKDQPSPSTKAETKANPQMLANQKRLEDLLATKVRIKHQGGKGKIELDYYTDDDFNRIYSILTKL